MSARIFCSCHLTCGCTCGTESALASSFLYFICQSWKKLFVAHRKSRERIFSLSLISIIEEGLKTPRQKALWTSASYPDQVALYFETTFYSKCRHEPGNREFTQVLNRKSRVAKFYTANVKATKGSGEKISDQNSYWIFQRAQFYSFQSLALHK